MTTQGVFILLTEKYAARLKSVLPFFFAGLLLLSCRSMVGFGEDIVKDTFLRQNITLLHSTPALPCQFSELHLPFESAPAPNDREMPNENEQEDDFDYDWNLVVEQQTLFSLFDLSKIRSWGIYSTSFMQSPSPVPFFVLYHSWKNYLS